MAGKLLFGVGTLPAVPKKITRKLMWVTPFRIQLFLLLGFCVRCLLLFYAVVNLKVVRERLRA